MSSLLQTCSDPIILCYYDISDMAKLIVMLLKEILCVLKKLAPGNNKFKQLWDHNTLS